MSLPPLDLRSTPKPQSRFEPFETEELEFMLSRIDQKESLIALGMSFEILRTLRDRTRHEITTERELPDGVRPAVD